MPFQMLLINICLHNTDCIRVRLIDTKTFITPLAFFLLSYFDWRVCDMHIEIKTKTSQQLEDEMQTSVSRCDSQSHLAVNLLTAFEVKMHPRGEHLSTISLSIHTTEHLLSSQHGIWGNSSFSSKETKSTTTSYKTAMCKTFFKQCLPWNYINIMCVSLRNILNHFLK